MLFVSVNFDEGWGVVSSRDAPCCFMISSLMGFEPVPPRLNGIQKRTDCIVWRSSGGCFCHLYRYYCCWFCRWFVVVVEVEWVLVVAMVSVGFGSMVKEVSVVVVIVVLMTE